MRITIRSGLVVHANARLVDELLDAHDEAKRNFYLGGLRLNAVEGGRFCEAAFRVLQERAFGAFDPLGRPLDTDTTIRRLGGLARGTQPDSIRLHIPRALRVVYDIRNSRNTAHLGDGIDPNLQDATLVVSTIDWVLAEFVRLFHCVSAHDAHQMIEALVTRSAPVIQDFSGFLKVLRADLAASDRVLVLLYQCNAAGATYAQLSEWVHPRMRVNLRRTLASLGDDKAFVHFDGSLYQITVSGQRHVEEKQLLAMPTR